MINLAGHEFEERELLKRALMCMRRVKYPRGTYRWVKVMNTFGVGSTVAGAICVEFGFDPEERVAK
jgi:hypothetical protein